MVFLELVFCIVIAVTFLSFKPTKKSEFLFHSSILIPSESEASFEMKDKFRYIYLFIVHNLTQS